MPISHQLVRDLREVVSAASAGDLTQPGLQLVFRVLPALLDELEVVGDPYRVQHIEPSQLEFWRTVVDGAPGAVVPLASISLRDLLDYVAHLQAARVELRRALRTAGESLRDRTRSAVTVRDAPADPASPHGSLFLRGGPLPFVLRGAVPVPPGQPRRSEVDGSLFDEVNLTLASPHRVRVMRDDGSVSLECDHTFHDTPHCVHCGKSAAELVRESRAEAELLRVPALLPDGVLTATPGELADVVQKQLDEHEGRGIVAMRGVSELDGALEPAADLAVPITLGPTLLPRIEALVASGRLGRDLPVVVQTLFVLGMLEAEGHEPSAHVGAPQSHVSAEALFVRFGLPHEDHPQRTAVMRQLLIDLSEWCDESDPLRPALSAALECLPR
jgi:hypothetical protein